MRRKMARVCTALLCALALAAVPAGALAKKGRDSDHDGLTDRQELKLGTNPHKADSDGDGLKDGAEVRTGNDPLRRSTDGDGVLDGHKDAGTVASFTNGVLTIKLANGRTVSGTLAGASASCESEAEHEAENASHHQRRHGASAHDARNGQPTGGGRTSSTETASGSGQQSGGGGQNETETEPADAAPAHHQSQSEPASSGGTCATGTIAEGTPVHKAVETNGVFTEVELVHG